MLFGASEPDGTDCRCDGRNQKGWWVGGGLGCGWQVGLWVVGGWWVGGEWGGGWVVGGWWVGGGWGGEGGCGVWVVGVWVVGIETYILLAM